MNHFVASDSDAIGLDFGGAFTIPRLAQRYESGAHDERLRFKATARAGFVSEMLPWFQIGQMQTASSNPPECYETK